jgi:hypothetical protein
MAGSNRSRWGEKPVRYRFHDALADIDPLEFERLMAEYYKGEGYEVVHSGTGRGSTFDGGVDLRLRKDGRLTLVQSKRKNAHQVTHNVVHELLGVKVNEGAAEAIVITTGEFTDAARAAGANGHVRLIEGVELRRLLGSRLDHLSVRRTAPPSDYVPTWEPLAIAEERPRRRQEREPRKKNEGAAVAGAVVLVFIALMQMCGRPRHSKADATPMPTQLQAVDVKQSEVGENRQRSAPASSNLPRALSVGPEPPAAAPSVEPRPLSAAEQAQRDEATRRYLERVPEVTHYRYSPLDQNRDPPPAREVSR